MHKATKDGIEFKNNEFKKYANQNPLWADFIMDFKRVWKDDFYFYQIRGLNIDETAEEEGYLGIESMIHFSWDYKYKDDEHPLDRQIDFYKHSASSQGYWAEPYVVVEYSKKFNPDYLKLQHKKCNNLLNLFMKYYDCFDDRQR